MKTLQKIFMFAIFSGLLMLIGCTNSEDAIVTVQVVDAAKQPVIDEPVYMCKLLEKAQTPESIEKTDVSGIARFTVKSIDIGESGTTRVFVTLDQNGNMKGYVQAYISSGARRIFLTLKQN